MLKVGLEKKGPRKNTQEGIPGKRSYDRGNKQTNKKKEYFSEVTICFFV